MNKKLFAIISTVLLVVFLCTGLYGCKKEAADPDEKKVVLFLGDSIGEAVAGPSPLTERESYGYYGILGKINGFEYYNRAVSGYQTKHLLSFIQREDDGVNMVKSLISTADIIHISILGNDLLGYDINKMIIEAADNVFTEEDKHLTTAAENLDKIVTYLRSVNPDATLIFQTQYNPIGSDSPLVRESTKNTLAEKSYLPKDYHKLAGRMIERLNKVLYDYLDDHSKKIFGKVTEKPFELVDVYSKFEDLYERSYTRWQGLFCPDGIHPTNEGHAIIAGVNQAKLEELGFASSDALQNYKNLRYAQLDRLYKDILNVAVAKFNIEKCTDMGDATLAYFNEIKGVSPYYENSLNYNGEHLDEDLVCSIDTLKISGNSLVPSTLFGLEVDLLTEESAIRFNADGTYEMRLEFTPFLIDILNLYISKSGKVDVTSMIGLDIVYLQRAYLQNMIPGIDYQDFEKSLQIIKKAFGVSIQGIDFERESVRKTANELAETGRIILNDSDILVNPVIITWSGQYRLQKVTSKLTGETYTAIYVNGGIDEGETYVRYTLSEKENGKQFVRLTVDVADIVIEGTEK